MSEFESVALWVGLLTGVASIILAVVSIAFAVMVNNRADAVNDKTIRALEKIETSVDHLSTDTRELIKAGWDKLLGGVGFDKAQVAATEVNAQEVAAGIASELRAELSALAGAKEGRGTAERTEKLEEVLKTFQETVEGQLRLNQQGRGPIPQMESLYSQITSLSQRGQALVREIEHRHIEQDEYKQLMEGPVGPALTELRASGLLIPVAHRVGEDRVPCYYFPPSTSRMVWSLTPHLPQPDPDARDEVRRELERVGYPVRRQGRSTVN